MDGVFMRQESLESECKLVWEGWQRSCSLPLPTHPPSFSLLVTVWLSKMTDDF